MQTRHLGMALDGSARMTRFTRPGYVFEPNSGVSPAVGA